MESLPDFGSAERAILDFVEGRLKPSDFETLLATDLRFESLLKPFSLPFKDNRADDLYTFLLVCNYRRIGEILNAQGALIAWLEHHQIAFKATPVYGHNHSLFLEASPRWIGFYPDYVEPLLALADRREGDELKKWLRTEIESRFHCLNKKPKWIQEPSWPIGENGPLVFLGQLDVSGYFHDAASIYIFHERATGRIETVVQMF